MKVKKGYAIKILTAAILAALFAGMLTGCGSTARTGAGMYSSLEDFEGITLGTISGSNYDINVEEVIDDVTFKTYPDLTGEISALSKGDIDGIVQDLSVATYLVAQHPEFTVFPETVAPNSFGYALQKDSPYTDEFTEVIQELYSDGTIEEMREKWFSGDDELMVIDWDEYDTSDRGKGFGTGSVCKIKSYLSKTKRWQSKGRFKKIIFAWYHHIKIAWYHHIKSRGIII